MTQEKLHSLFYYKDNNLYWRESKAGKGNYKRRKDSIAGGVEPSGYRRITISGKRYQAHSLIYIYHYGPYTNDYVVDHIDRVKDNNSIDNLRIITRRENTQNNNSKGYSWNKRENKWVVRIVINKVRSLVGKYDNEDDAKRARYEAELIHYPHKIYKSIEL